MPLIFLHPLPSPLLLFFFNDTPPTEIYTLSLHDALPITKIARSPCSVRSGPTMTRPPRSRSARSEEHTSELQSRGHLVCRLLLEKKKKFEKSTSGWKFKVCVYV